MAASSLGPPPITLSCVSPGYYEDENRRLWVVVNLGFKHCNPMDITPGDSITVHLWETSRSQLQPHTRYTFCFNCLPNTWELYSVTSYSGTDATFWKLEDHSQVDDTEQLVLRKDNNGGFLYGILTSRTAT